MLKHFTFSPFASMPPIVPTLLPKKAIRGTPIYRGVLCNRCVATVSYFFIRSLVRSLMYRRSSPPIPWCAHKAHARTAAGGPSASRRGWVYPIVSRQGPFSSPARPATQVRRSQRAENKRIARCSPHQSPRPPIVPSPSPPFPLFVRT